MEKKELKRTKQCSTCPWKVSSNPYDIPHGYSEDKHKDLERTIAKDTLHGLGSVHVMSCHHSNTKDEEYCIGWLENQLGVGNNIGMRIRMMHYTNTGEIETFGEQHEKFEQTLPENKGFTGPTNK